MTYRTFHLEMPTNLYPFFDSSDINERFFRIFLRAITARLVDARLRWQDQTKKSLSSLPPRVQRLFLFRSLKSGRPARALLSERDAFFGVVEFRDAFDSS